ncbi:MAG: hypothetical protein WC360_04795 [Opitutales bacterium]|jgi:hypothetical protein
MLSGPRIALFAALAAMAAGPLSALTIRQVSTRTYSEEELTSISEITSGRECAGRRTYFRTDPTCKAGRYFIVDLDTPARELQAGCSLVMEIIRGSDGQTELLTLPFSSATGSMGKALFLGLTDEAHSAETVLAWRLTIRDAAGATLAEKHSFLWEMPAE